ncbi:MAG: LCP family protein [Pseudonocardiaceae bacterium]
MDDRPPRPGGYAGRPHRRRHATPPLRRRPANGLRGAKLALALVSALVLSLTGYGWATFQSLQQGLSTTDVIGFSAPDRATDILLVGMDSRTDAQDNPLPADVLSRLRAGDNEGELTDTMILVRIPNDGTRAVAISLPRDLYVQMPDGYGMHKLNSAFIRAKSATAERLVAQDTDPAVVRTESIAAGRKLLLQSVKDLTGVGIDHYAEINLLGFSLLTEAVGGVEVCLREPVRDEFSGANFPVGPQVISGPDALAFVRQRHGLPRGDLDRIVRQQVYLAALADKVLTAGTLSSPRRIRQLIDATQQSLVLDQDLDVLDFAARMQGLAAGNVMFETVPVLGNGDSESDGDVLKVDPQAVQAFVARAVDVAPAPDLTPGSPARATVTVDVLNGSGQTGLAKSVSEQLAGQGFAQGAVGNTPARATSVVRYPSGEQDAGQAVADTLGGLPVEEGSNLTAGTVQVYLGRDHPGPVKPRIAGASFLRVDGSAAINTGRPIADIARAAPAPAPRPPMMSGDVPCVF